MAFSCLFYKFCAWNFQTNVRAKRAVSRATAARDRHRSRVTWPVNGVAHDRLLQKRLAGDTSAWRFSSRPMTLPTAHVELAEKIAWKSFPTSSQYDISICTFEPTKLLLKQIVKYTFCCVLNRPCFPRSVQFFRCTNLRVYAFR